MTGFPPFFSAFPASATIIRQFPHTGNKSAFSSQKMQVKESLSWPILMWASIGHPWPCAAKIKVPGRIWNPPLRRRGRRPRRPAEASAATKLLRARPLQSIFGEVLFVFPPVLCAAAYSRFPRRSISRIFSSSALSSRPALRNSSSSLWVYRSSLSGGDTAPPASAAPPEAHGSYQVPS